MSCLTDMFRPTGHGIDRFGNPWVQRYAGLAEDSLTLDKITSDLQNGSFDILMNAAFSAEEDLFFLLGFLHFFF